MNKPALPSKQNKADSGTAKIIVNSTKLFDHHGHPVSDALLLHSQDIRIMGFVCFTLFSHNLDPVL